MRARARGAGRENEGADKTTADPDTKIEVAKLPFRCCLLSPTHAAASNAPVAPTNLAPTATAQPLGFSTLFLLRAYF